MHSFAPWEQRDKKGVLFSFLERINMSGKVKNHNKGGKMSKHSNFSWVRLFFCVCLILMFAIPVFAVDKVVLFVDQDYYDAARADIQKWYCYISNHTKYDAVKQVIDNDEIGDIESIRDAFFSLDIMYRQNGDRLKGIILIGDESQIPAPPTIISGIYGVNDNIYGDFGRDGSDWLPNADGYYTSATFPTDYHQEAWVARYTAHSYGEGNDLSSSQINTTLHNYYLKRAGEDQHGSEGKIITDLTNNSDLTWENRQEIMHAFSSCAWYANENILTRAKQWYKDDCKAFIINGHGSWAHCGDWEAENADEDGSSTSPKIAIYDGCSTGRWTISPTNSLTLCTINSSTSNTISALGYGMDALIATYYHGWEDYPYKSLYRCIQEQPYIGEALVTWINNVVRTGYFDGGHPIAATTLNLFGDGSINFIYQPGHTHCYDEFETDPTSDFTWFGGTHSYNTTDEWLNLNAHNSPQYVCADYKEQTTKHTVFQADFRFKNNSNNNAIMMLFARVDPNTNPGTSGSSGSYWGAIGFDGGSGYANYWSGVGKVTGTSWQKLASYNSDVPKPKLNQWYTIKLTAIGSSIKLYLDDRLVAQATDNSITHNGQGAIQPCYGDAYIDNLVFAWGECFGDAKSAGSEYAKNDSHYPVLIGEYLPPRPPEISETTIPDVYSLSISPNPFVSSSTIKFTLSKKTGVSLKIYNVSGQCVKTLLRKEFEAGYYDVRWDGRDESGISLSRGVYFCRMETENFRQTRKLIFMK